MVVLDVLGSVMLLEVGVAHVLSRRLCRLSPRAQRAHPTLRMAHPAHTARTHETSLDNSHTEPHRMTA